MVRFLKGGPDVKFYLFHSKLDFKTNSSDICEDYSFWSSVTSTWNTSCIADPYDDSYPIVRKCIAHQKTEGMFQKITQEHCAALLGILHDLTK